MYPFAQGDLKAAGTPEHAVMHDFLLHLVLNHSVVVEKVRNDQGEVVNTRLSASSPDEEAFVLAGRFFGCVSWYPSDASQRSGATQPVVGGVS